MKIRDPSFQTKIYLAKVTINMSIVKQDLIHGKKFLKNCVEESKWMILVFIDNDPQAYKLSFLGSFGLGLFQIALSLCYMLTSQQNLIPFL